jgi:hypothetical protein
MNGVKGNQGLQKKTWDFLYVLDRISGLFPRRIKYWL